jgi:hypothetical protein
VGSTTNRCRGNAKSFGFRDIYRRSAQLDARERLEVFAFAVIITVMPSDVKIIRNLHSNRMDIHSAALRLFENGHRNEVISAFRETLKRIQKTVAETRDDNSGKKIKWLRRT